MSDVYEFTLTREKGEATPSADKWLNPQYGGIGDGWLVTGINQRAGDLHLKPLPNNMPMNAKTEFPEYFWEIDELQSLKQALNKAKSQMNPIQLHDADRFHRFQQEYRGYDLLKGSRGILVREYGAEVVTNAWLKMYEMARFLEPTWARIEKTKTREHSARLNTLMIAEAPGNFIVAMNHYLQMEHRTIHWDWLANSYRDPVVTKPAERPQGKFREQGKASSNPGETGYLGDKYGLMSGFPDRWLYGPDCDGDITSVNNIRGFQASMAVRGWSEGRADLVTSDVKYVPDPPNYDEEELTNRAVQTGHFIASLACLKPKGAAVLKEFSHLEGSSVAQLYMAGFFFQSVRVLKPRTSKGPNSETYLLLEGFKGITDDQLQRFYTYMTYIRFMNFSQVNGCPAMLQLDHVPTKFIKRVVEMQTALVEEQIQELKQMMAAYEEYKRGNFDQAGAVKASSKLVADWIKSTGVKPLPKELQIMKHRISH